VRAGWYRFRSTFRRRARSYLGIAVLLGVLGGVSLAAIAGARRTASSFSRFHRSTNPSDIQVTTGVVDPELVDRTARLPEVRRATSYYGLAAGVLTEDHRPYGIETVASPDGLYLDQDRFVPTRGGC